MQSAFDSFSRFGPAGLIVEALAVTSVAIGLLLAFILLRRTYRRRYFRRRERRVLEVRRNWEAFVSGAAQPERRRPDRLEREVVADLLLERLDAASPEETKRLQQCLHSSGLLNAALSEARQWRGWRRRQALLSLGRMRVPEGIPVLSEALDDRSQETRVAAVRGLGRIGLPQAAEPILERLLRGQLVIPTPVLQNALLSCHRLQPSLLIPFVHRADDSRRPLLARVLAEVATPDLGRDFLLLASDPLAEVRASAARGIAQARPPFALGALATLAADEEWFVRLRAAVAIGDLHDPHGIPILVEALCDRNRYVRLRAATALVELEGHEERILYLTEQTQDRYALQALVSELERSGRIPKLVSALRDPGRRLLTEFALLAVLRGGSYRILVNLILCHGEWRARGALARLLARSRDALLLDHLEQLEPTLGRPRQQRVVRWLIGQLHRGVALRDRPESVLVQ
jgi:HEAT repeat protein